MIYNYVFNMYVFCLYILHTYIFTRNYVRYLNKYLFLHIHVRIRICLHVHTCGINKNVIDKATSSLTPYDLFKGTEKEKKILKDETKHHGTVDESLLKKIEHNFLLRRKSETILLNLTYIAGWQSSRQTKYWQIWYF